MDSNKAGVLVEVLLEGRSVPALAPPSAALILKSGSFEACTMSALERAQIEPERMLDSCKGRVFIQAINCPTHSMEKNTNHQLNITWNLMEEAVHRVCASNSEVCQTDRRRVYSQA